MIIRIQSFLVLDVTDDLEGEWKGDRFPDRTEQNGAHDEREELFYLVPASGKERAYEKNGVIDELSCERGSDKPQRD